MSKELGGHSIGQLAIRHGRNDPRVHAFEQRVAYPSSVAAKALVYVPDLSQPEIDAGDLHHLVKVLRLEANEPLILADGEGHWCLATLEFAPASSGSPRLMSPKRSKSSKNAFHQAISHGTRVLGPLQYEPVRKHPVKVGMVPLKGDRTERSLRQLTELGVDEVVLYHARRSVVRWGASEERARLERLHRVVREAGMQSRRARLPILTSLLGHHDGVRAAASYVEGALVITHPGGPSLGIGPRAELSGALFLVGPEGGFEDDELQQAKVVLGLGPTVLRAETAVVAMAARLVWLSELEQSSDEAQNLPHRE